jgi:hypothetical protein
VNFFQTFLRFKLHVQVMDNTGSTSFILFDRNVSNYVGKSVQDLIDAQGQVIESILMTDSHLFWVHICFSCY